MDKLTLPRKYLCQHTKTGSRYGVYGSAENHTPGKDDGKLFYVYAAVADPERLFTREIEDFWAKFMIIENMSA